MPSTWTAYSKRNSNCQSDVLEQFICQREDPAIEEGTVIVRVRDNGPTVDFHPECWLEAGIALVAAKPYIKNQKGRRKLDLTDAEAEARRKLLSRYSSFGSRLRRYEERIADGGDPNEDILKISVQTLKLQQDKIYIEISEFGGPPDTWRKPESLQEVA